MTATFALVTLAFWMAIAPVASGAEPGSSAAESGLGPPDEVQKAAALDHVVEFADETRMHGQVLKLDADALVLQRTDAKEPLVFPLREAPLDDKIPAFDIAQLAHALHESIVVARFNE